MIDDVPSAVMVFSLNDWTTTLSLSSLQDHECLLPSLPQPQPDHLLWWGEGKLRSKGNPLISDQSLSHHYVAVAGVYLMPNLCPHPEKKNQIRHNSNYSRLWIPVWESINHTPSPNFHRKGNGSLTRSASQLRHTSG